MAITRFEEIEAWQLARGLCRKIHDLTLTGGLAKDFSLKDQIQRSSGSVMDNIAEGFDAGGNNDFVRFLGYSKRSCSEVQSQLHRILDCGYCNRPDFDELYEDTRLVRAKIGAFIHYLESSGRRSPATLKAKSTNLPQPLTLNGKLQPGISTALPTGNREP